MKLSRLWANIWIILIYAGAQVSSLIPAAIYHGQNLSPSEMMTKVIPYMIGAFVLASILVYFINRSIKDETRLERSPKERWLYTIIWVIAGFFMALIIQAIMNMINVYILHQPIESQNTNNIMAVAKQYPFFIVIISLAGPFLEEFVFRKVIFGELYEWLNLPRWAAFLIAGTLSGLLFAAAHMDFDHTLIYLGMAFVFAGLYVATRRIIVPILAHMAMNSFVVIMQLALGDKLNEAADQLKSTSQLIWHLFQ
ncbi:intramembrane glutamic endopeptidase MroQ [Macrococcus carouselicus]|uniref:CPBP family intramembrane metalloprotease n=1 Tax=Macrococcus carouselicus TaxID=69969 RepID=A0A9Q8FKC9_9STAP|nr:type II CAAX endopeptidase family protein [Macrococcus carouselicus]TDM00668.1 CPBP family intramembrane metalloprotease [Macrococcus carouselicus]